MKSCYQCEERAVGCHATCQDYKARTEKSQEDKESLRRQKRATGIADDFTAEGYYKRKKRVRR